MKRILFENKEHRLRLNSLKKRLSEETQNELTERNQIHSSLQKQQNHLKEQNDLFYNSYHRETSHLKRLDPFTDLKKEYTERGYRIPNLSLSNVNNIFKVNPLLLENSRDIDIYFDMKSKETANTERPKRYLLKIQKTLNQRMNNIGHKPQKKMKEFSSLCSIRSVQECAEDEQTVIERRKENDLIRRYNKRIEGMIENDAVLSSITDKGKQRDRLIAMKLSRSQNMNMNSFFKLPSHYSFHPSEDITHLETSATDMTLSQMNKPSNKKIASINTFPQLKYSKQATINTRHTNTNTMSDCSSSLCRRSSTLDEIKKSSSNGFHLYDKVFESKKRFFEYLSEINVSSLTYDSLIVIIKEYLRKIKEWKEERIKQFLSSETIAQEVNALVLDFSQKITHFDITKSIPDKTKTLNVKRLMKVDLIAKGLPKYIVRRMIRKVSSKKKVI